MGRKNRRDRSAYDRTNFHKLFVELTEKQERRSQRNQRIRTMLDTYTNVK